VGQAPTSSVVTSSLWILISDFFLTKLLLVS
jgi:phospholipid/cholesterol/gamma-HCH transport system permease protein